MLAFTFPGQGSQRSGMGHAWVEHPSWEVAAEASDIAGRDLTSLLLDAPMEELTRDGQRPAGHVRDEPGGAGRRRAPRPVPGGLRRPQPGRVHRAGRLGCALPVRRDPAGHRAGKCHAGGGRRASRAPWPPSSASPTTTPRRPASGPRTRCGWPTTTLRARWSSPEPWPGWPRPPSGPRSSGPARCCPSRCRAPSTPS